MMYLHCRTKGTTQGRICWRARDPHRKKPPEGAHKKSRPKAAFKFLVFLCRRLKAGWRT
jgi:hypothetical protein